MQILLRNLLFINYAVAPERVRQLVPPQFDLETRQDERGNARAFVSAVPFEVAEIRSSSLSMPGLRFNQINYRAYLISPEGGAVYFLSLKVGSRMVAASAGFLQLPVSYEAIGLSVAAETADGDPGRAMRYGVEAEGLTAYVSVGAAGASSEAGGDPAVTTEFISERPVGFIRSTGGDNYKIAVEHLRLDAVRARVESVRSPLLESLGILDPGGSELPHSVLYVKEALFDARTPTKWPA
jgi:uncharacterized protein YqjF (DUF2071 family)